MSCVARNAVLLKPDVVGVHIIQFRSKEVGDYRPIVLAFTVIAWPTSFTKKYGLMTAPATPNSDFFGMLLDLVWIDVSVVLVLPAAKLRLTFQMNCIYLCNKYVRA